MFIYQTAPVDFFAGMLPIAYAAEKMREELGNEEVFKLIRLAMDCSRAVSLAKGSYWEGDIRGFDLFVFALPDPDATPPHIGLTWKQENNGTTYICSPVALPWISDDDLLPNVKIQRASPASGEAPLE